MSPTNTIPSITSIESGKGTGPQCFETAVQRNRSIARRHPRRTFVILVLIFLVLAAMAKAYYDTNTIEVRHYEIAGGSFGGALEGLKVAFLADLHVKEVGAREKKALELLQEEKPDMILLGGDLIGFNSPYAPLVSFLSRLTAPLGIYAVLGNTEYSNENGSCILCHEANSRKLKQRTHAKVIRNASVLVEANEKAVNIAGLDDPVKGKADVDKTLGTVNPKHPTVLLSHSPEIFDEASIRKVDVILSGHTHGGQWFIMRYLRRIFPSDPALEFLDGFFQKGRVPLYVNRGLGTSYLPFRFGVKPEITVLTFTGLQRYANLHRDLAISNHPPETVFLGINLSSILETFNLFSVLVSPNSESKQKRPINPGGSVTPKNAINATNLSQSLTLADFDSEEELQQLNWECHKWFALSKEHVTSGHHSLKVTLPAGQFPGIDFQNLREDWSGSRFLRMDVFNSSREEVTFHIRIDDHKSGWGYANRFDINFALKPGMNKVLVFMEAIRTNVHSRPLNLKKIKRMMVFIPSNDKTRELYLDNVRLE